MDKRYQVFVSSTYIDLRAERQAVIQALLELDCIPAGMELFPASDEERWELIRRVIDDCDYYIVIVGGRYGSEDQDGISYTEREYDYAVSVGKPVLGFLHAAPDELPSKDSEHDRVRREKLEAFRSKVGQRMWKRWSNADDLAGAVSRGLVNAIKRNPGIGWVRGSEALTPEVIADMANLRAQVAEMQLDKRAAPSTEDLDGLAQGDDPLALEYLIPGTGILGAHTEPQAHQVGFTWNDLFKLLGPHMLHEASEHDLKHALVEVGTARLSRELWELSDPVYGGPGLDVPDREFQKVKVQLIALGLIDRGQAKRGVADKASYWVLTQHGEHLLMNLSAIRRPTAD